MTLIVEDGSGLATAESFSSVTSANTYIENRYGAGTTWASKTDAQKEQYLRLGTEFLVNQYRGRWKGEMKTTTQALPWPRINVTDEEGNTRSSSILPPELVYATVESAKRLSEGTTLEEDLKRGGHVEMVQVGPITKKLSQSATPETRYTRIDRLLSGLLTSGTGYRRVVRS
jgi:hypothetical protein